MTQVELHRAVTPLLQDIVDNTSAVIYVKDLDGRYLLVNRQFESLFGLSRGSVIGQTDFDIFPRELADAFRVNDDHVARTGHLLECEEQAPHVDGLHVYISIKFPLRDPQRRMYAVAGISTDITERRQAQQAITVLQHQTELLLESVADGICGLDAQGRVRFLNPAAERMLGWSTAHLTGKPLVDILQWPQDARQWGSVEAALQAGERSHVEHAEIVRIDGRRIPVECVASPVYESGHRTGAVVAIRDLRDRIERQRAEQELQAASRVQQFLYPSAAPSVPEYDIAGAAKSSARVCGDYFDFIPWGEHAWCLALGDVSGHGFGPALQMVETRAVLRAALHAVSTPGAALARLNDVLCDDLPEGTFVTLFVAKLCTNGAGDSYSSAGHPGGLLRTDSSVVELASKGFPLGLMSGAPYETMPIEIGSGDILVLTSDGVQETIGPEQTLFGRERLWSAVQQAREQSASEIRDAIFRATTAFACGEPQHDDATIIIAKRQPGLR